uniref:BZIP5 n=1 Tax=Fagopyrum tataricum TaxID=62330 RepID=A0A7D6J8E6_FAGTA|nr:bZIP5 [Fagopyrum tataricum]
MGSNLNMKCFDDEPPEGNGSGRPSGNFSFPLARQTSIYSLTFDEFQNSLGKEFGSMNMDELMKSIWTAEETLNMASTASISNGGGGVNQGGYIQRQGSLTLPRTISQKTVDEVWRDVSTMPQQATQRQPTLGEITLEEFLLRAGLVREDANSAEKPNPSGLLGELSQADANNTVNSGFAINFQQPSHGVGLIGSNLGGNSVQPQVPLQSPDMVLNVNGAISSQQQQQQLQLQQPPLYPKQSAVSYAPTMGMVSSTQVGCTGIRSGVVGFTNQTTNGNLGQGFGLQGGEMAVAAGSHATMPCHGVLKRNEDTPCVSPAHYGFNGGLRGRKRSNTVEKVIERRQKRMIKNRESAARSRARKQAYTTELEQEVAKLKEEIEDLRTKEVEIKEMFKNQILTMMNEQQCGAKKRCLRRTQTGVW